MPSGARKPYSNGIPTILYFAPAAANILATIDQYLLFIIGYQTN